MSTLSGGCHCGNIRIELELTRAPESYNPRACDCDFCTKHSAAYVSEPKGSLAIRVKDAGKIGRYRQGNGIAEFLICTNCGVLVGVVYDAEGRVYGAANAKAIQGARLRPGTTRLAQDPVRGSEEEPLAGRLVSRREYDNFLIARPTGHQREVEYMRVIACCFGSVFAAVLTGCAGVVAQPPISPGQSVQLQPGEGIVALLMDTYDPLTQIRLASPDDKNPILGLPSMPAGRTLALFTAPAGIYCLKQFSSGRYRFGSQTLDVGCFHVVAGHIAYSGNMVPKPDPAIGSDGAVTDQQYQPTVFLSLLKQQYPQVMLAYPTAGPSPASEGGAQNDINQEVATWSVESADHKSFDVFFRNNTNWDLALDSFEMTVCTNIKQKCGPQTVSMPLAPNTTVKFMTVEQADVQQAYEFNYRYNYDRPDTGSKQ